MTAARRKKNPWSTVVAFAVLIALVAYRYYGDRRDQGDVSHRRPAGIAAAAAEADAGIAKQGGFDVICGFAGEMMSTGTSDLQFCGCVGVFLGRIDRNVGFSARNPRRWRS